MTKNQFKTWKDVLDWLRIQNAKYLAFTIFWSDVASSFVVETFEKRREKHS
jgi:hypothetical protein